MSHPADLPDSIEKMPVCLRLLLLTAAVLPQSVALATNPADC